jgi:hypothetical protein
VQAVQERTPVPVDGLGESLLLQSLRQGYGVALEDFRRDAQLLPAPPKDGLTAQTAAKPVEGLAQGIARVLLVQLRPEHRKQGVTSAKAPGRRQGQIGQQREQLGL